MPTHGLSALLCLAGQTARVRVAAALSYLAIDARAQPGSARTSQPRTQPRTVRGWLAALLAFCKQASYLLARQLLALQTDARLHRLWWRTLDVNLNGLSHMYVCRRLAQPCMHCLAALI